MQEENVSFYIFIIMHLPSAFDYVHITGNIEYYLSLFFIIIFQSLLTVIMLQVSSEDKLPKMVCGTCVKRLENIHRFAMMAYRTQEKLKLQLYNNTDNTDTIEDVELESIKDVQDTTKKTEDRGLLHTILTKVNRKYYVF